jgi:hypothetical protein
MTQVFANPKTELEACQATVNQLKDWQSKNWAIGLSYGGSHQPDGFFKFFAARNMSFDSYIAASDLQVGGPGSYDVNLRTLEQYMEAIVASENHAVDSNIKTIKDWHSRNWAIGLVYNTGQLDGFSKFLALRGLTCHYYVRYTISVGDSGAYDAMIAELESYRSSLSPLQVAPQSA